MINITTDKKINIVMPNTNRALAEVLKEASPKELEVITKGKDLKSIVNSLLKESTQSSSSDKALLDIVKNNPTFKELGNASSNIKDLINLLKSDKNLVHVEKLIQKFLPNIEEAKNTNVKATIENSGVFLESKIKDIQNPQLTLKNQLINLSNLLQKSDMSNAKKLNTEVKQLLSSENFKEVATNIIDKNPKAFQILNKDIQNILSILKTAIDNEEPITSKDVATKLQKLEHLLEPKNLDKENFKLNTIKNSLSELIVSLKKSETKEPQTFLTDLKNVNKSIKSVELNNDIKNIVDKLKVELKDAGVDTSKKIIQTINKLENNTLAASVQESLKQIMLTAQNSPTKFSSSIIDELAKIFKILQTTEEQPFTSKPALEQFMDKRIPTELKSIIEEIKTFIKNADPFFSKATKDVFENLLIFKSPNALSKENLIKDILSDDFKAVLHKASEEVSKLTSPNQSDIAKQIDKLTLQIDYYQLLSHLSNSSSLYIPFSWEEMEDGNISINKAQKDKFYCDIDLKLKEYGELKLRLTIYEKNQLNIHVHSDNEGFKNILKENLPHLRRALIDVQITPREIRFFNSSKNSTVVYGDTLDNLDIGFEIKA